MALSELALQSAQTVKAALNPECWSEQKDGLQTELSRMETELAKCLRVRGVTPHNPVSAVLEAYEADCTERDHQAREASQRNHFESALEFKKREEAIAVDAEFRRNEASSSLQELVRNVGLPDANDEELAVELEEWLEAYTRLAEDRKRAVEEWQELEGFLRGGSI